MEQKRQFIIILSSKDQSRFYLQKIKKNSLGYYFMRTINPKKAKIWKIKKKCETAIDKIEKLLDPTQTHLKKYKLEVVEITDNQTLRQLKLKKLNKK